ncbi:MAG: hypothetical protein LBH22_09185 [Bacteroidales bacterium]|jgi:hypothetical protein|nr:hypothetical protein [Bacteroidales bacterium]
MADFQINERLEKFIKEGLKITPFAFSKSINDTGGVKISKIINKKYGVSNKILDLVCEAHPEVNRSWLLTGEGNMLKSDPSKQPIQFFDPENAPHNKRLIPLYDDVLTVGGTDTVALTEANRAPAEWIDPGDWFKPATHAIRHYGESMVEYPKGCILALKEVQDRRLVVPGQDYVIQTSEYRVTKKIQLGNSPEYIIAHSTNYERYDDHSLIHQPFNIYWELITNIYEVLGYVVKKGSGTIVLSNQR